MFAEQIGWAADAGADFIIGETFSYAQEALIALEEIKKAKLVAVMTLAMHQEERTREAGLQPTPASAWPTQAPRWSA